MTDTLNNEQLPTPFGPYYLFDFIGKGGMAEIFLAKTLTEIGTERLVVIKRILPHLNKDKDFCEMLINEAKIVANLSHANIVETLQLGQIEHQYYIAMEYVEGLDLNKLLSGLSKAGVALPLQFALYIIIETLKGLDYAHRASDSKGKPYNIIHRDVSPTNVLISTEGEVKLCDFGIAKVAQDELETGSIHVNEQHIKGKIAYMAPEHIAGTPIDQRADLFTVGILLWELLSGKRLYKSKDQEETFKKAKEAHVPDIIDRGFPNYEALSSIVKKALAKEVNDRFANGREFIRSIEDYLHVTGQIVSQLRFSEFLMETLGELLLQQKQSRKKQASTLGESMMQPISKKPSSNAPPTQGQNQSPFTLALLSDDEEVTPSTMPAENISATTSLADNLAQKFEREERISTSIPSKPANTTKPLILPISLAVAVLTAVIVYYCFFS